MVTVRYPSVTTVLEILDKPALSTWKAQQAVRALYRMLVEAELDSAGLPADHEDLRREVGTG